MEIWNYNKLGWEGYNNRSRSKVKVKKIVCLVRNSTWRCGKIERFIVNFLRRRFTRKASLNEILDVGENTFRRQDIGSAIHSLKRRQIVKVIRNGV